MKYDLDITKIVATGNDFIILDNISGKYSDKQIDYSELARELCTRRFSVGADGLLVLEDHPEADVRMRIINPDGSEVDMCGNGARATAFYVYTKGAKDHLSISTGAGIIHAWNEGDNVKLKMSDPKEIIMDRDLEVDHEKMTAHTLNTGVPHVVCLVEDIENYPVEKIGSKIRYLSDFAPEGTNVNFVAMQDKNIASVRTYERGVEAETLACGTGSVASAIVLCLLKRAESPVTIITSSKEELKVYLDLAGGTVRDVYLEGACRIVFKTRILK